MFSAWTGPGIILLQPSFPLLFVILMPWFILNAAVSDSYYDSRLCVSQITTAGLINHRGVGIFRSSLQLLSF